MRRGVQRRGRVTLLLVAWLAFAASVALLPVGPKGNAKAGAQSFTCHNTEIPLPSLSGVTQRFANGLNSVDASYVLPVAGPVALTVGSGGTAPAAAATLSSGTVGWSAAAFVGGFVGTCKAMDWIFGEGQSRYVPYTTPGPITRSGPVLCSDLGVPDHPAGSWCQSINVGTLTPHWRSVISNQYGGASPSFNSVTLPNPASTQMNEYVDSTLSGSVVAYFRSGTTWCINQNNQTITTSGACGTAKPGSDTYIVGLRCGFGASYTGDVEQTMGGTCGIHPNGLAGLVDESNSNGGQIRAVWKVSQQAGTYGWLRRLRTEATCLPTGSASGGPTRVSTWTHAYWDRNPTARAIIPTCAAGYTVSRLRIWRVTAHSQDDKYGLYWANTKPGVADWTVSEADAPARNWAQNPWASTRIIYEWTAPSTWTSGTAPAWLVCLAAGSNCGTPEINEGVCEWGGIAVPMDFCTGERVAPTHPTQPKQSPVVVRTSPVTDVDAPGSTSPIVDPGAEPDPTPSPTTTIPTTPTTTPGGGGPTTTTPSGCPAAAGCPGLLPIEDEGGDCMPEGWGWFNPIDWVLKPIKCAFRWAFIPSEPEMQDRMDAFASLRDEPPLQWADSSATWLSDSDIQFADWSTAGPPCTNVLGNEVCPRDWDDGTSFPAWASSAVIAMFWFFLVYAVVRFF